jgi:phenylalanyl-tRNA synthetase alpha chain
LKSQENGTDLVENIIKIMGEQAYSNGRNNGMKKKWFKPSGQEISINSNTPESKMVDDDADLLRQLKDSEFFQNDIYKKFQKNKGIKVLKRRKTLEIKELLYFGIKPGKYFREKITVLKADITAQDLKEETWKDESNFKEMNLHAEGKEISTGGLHPLLKVRTEFRHILLHMGFEEMKTNQFVESSFWNFDTLFQPQQHPARDAQDTFFVKDPEFYNLKSQGEYAEKVKTMHQTGFKSQDSESFGWRYKFQDKEASKNILRTHTTAVSSRTLYDLRQSLEGKTEAETQENLRNFKGKKYFSIDRVFRNETLDSTHLAEFHQIEGLIVGRNLGLAQLKSFISEFFAKIGITKLKFKPAYNPYTEPSMEFFVYHPGLKKMIEIGNSGIFRPEMLVPMGWPEDISVIAWGLSLERPAMLLFQCSNIRDLCGHKVNAKWVRDCSVIDL